MLYIENVKGQQAPMKTFDVAITETIGSLDSLAFSYVVNNRDAQDFNRNANALMTPGSIMTEPKTGKKFKLLTVSPSSLGDYQQYAITGISLGKNLHNYYVTAKLTSVTVSTHTSTSKDAKGNSTTTTSKTTKTAKTTVTIKTSTAVNAKAGTETVTISTTTKNNVTGTTTTTKTVHRHTNRKVTVKTVHHSKHSHHAKKKAAKQPATTTTTTVKKATDTTTNSSDDSGSSSSSATVNKRSLTACLSLITDGTPFKFKITGKFGSFDFGGDFGNDYADSLLTKLAKDFDFEYYFDNYTICVVKSIGKKNEFLFIENANVSKISSQEDYTDITTEIIGYGKKNSNGQYSVLVGYKSPVEELWGRIDAKPLTTSLTDSSQITAKLKKQIHDYPSVQYTVSYVDFKNNLQGFHNDTTPGNWGYLRSRFGIDMEVRIQSRTYYPQDAKNTGSITFGNTIFDPVVYQQKIQKTYRSDYQSSIDQAQSASEITDKTLINKINELGGELL